MTPANDDIQKCRCGESAITACLRCYEPLCEDHQEESGKVIISGVKYDKLPVCKGSCNDHYPKVKLMSFITFDSGSFLMRGPGVYILEGKTAKKRMHRFYVGATKDIYKRLKAHQGMKTSFGRLCSGKVEIVYFKKIRSYTEALSQEKAMKKLDVKAKEFLKNNWKGREGLFPISPAVYLLQARTIKRRDIAFAGSSSNLNYDIERHRSELTHFGKQCQGDFKLVFYMMVDDYSTATGMKKSLKILLKRNKAFLTLKWRIEKLNILKTLTWTMDLITEEEQQKLQERETKLMPRL